MNNLDSKSWSKRLRQNEPQMLRLRRTSLALVGAFVLTIICYIFFKENLFRVSPHQFFWMIFLFWIGNLSFLLFIASGYNKHLKDPSLTVPQIFWGISTTMVAIYFTNELRSVLLMMSLLAILFASFYVRNRQLYLIVLYSIACYALIIFLLKDTPGVIFNLYQEIITLFIYSLVALCFASFILEIIGLRAHTHVKATGLLSELKKSELESLTDPLTGIGNRKYILELLERQRLLTSRKEQYHFCIMLLDIDFFKKVNDQFGHKIGDLVLQLISTVTQKTIRKIDFMGRIGGEEFLIITPFSDLIHAKISAERVRSSVEAINFDNLAPNLKITLSIGCTQYHWPESLEVVLKRVDEALYVAKKGGRNQVAVL